MSGEHVYRAAVRWTGNSGAGTSRYGGYSRAHDIIVGGKPPIAGSADPAFRGDPARHTPEDMLVASLAACHMLWYLHLCAVNGLCVLAYHDEAEGRMRIHETGAGEFTGVTLAPRITLRRGSDLDTAQALHGEAHTLCFIARSVNFPVQHQPQFTFSG